MIVYAMIIILYCLTLNKHSFNIVKDVEQVRGLVSLISSLVTKSFGQYVLISCWVISIA